MEDLVRDVADRPLLFPCGISRLARTMNAFYLDQRPPRHDWVLVGCERSRQIHRHFYGEDCPRIELCPREVFEHRQGLALLRCCMIEKQVEVRGRAAFVPWGADVDLVEEALTALVALAEGVK
jgi:hypothetical protein